MNAPRRIVLALESSGPGGAEQMVLRLACALRRAGDAPLIATLRPGWMTERAAEAGLPVWLVPQRRGLDPLWIARFARRLRRARVALVHTHEFAMNAYAGAAAWLAGVPSVATVHGHQYATARGRRVAAYRVLCRANMALVAVSSELAEFLSRGLRVPAERIRVVPNGVPQPERQLRAPTREQMRDALGVPERVPLVLAVGNLYPVKDHATLIRALARLPDAELAIAGRGGEEPALRALAEELGVAKRVHLLGLRTDVPELMAAADVFAQPSRSEGLPLALLEAMSAGLPAVASAVGGMAEAVQCGRSGLLVPPGDPRALGAALERVITCPEFARRLGNAARERIAREYSIERMAESYLQLYDERLTLARRSFPSRSSQSL